MKRPCVYDGVTDPMTQVPIDHHSDDILAVHHGRVEPTYICGYHEERFSVPGAAKSPLNSDHTPKERHVQDA